MLTKLIWLWKSLEITLWQSKYIGWDQTKAHEKVLPSMAYATVLALEHSLLDLKSWRTGSMFCRSKQIKFIDNASIPDLKHGFQQISIAFWDNIINIYK